MERMSQQTQKRKFQPCRNNCGTLITFDARHKNANGTKFVPLVVGTDSLGQERLTPHNCPLYKPGVTSSATAVTAGAGQPKVSTAQPQNNDDRELKTLMLQVLRRLNEIESKIQDVAATKNQ
jgi:hypothetical protein